MKIQGFYGTGLFEENSFLITDEKTGTSAIIDPCFVDKSIIENMTKIDFILLTHGHYDHIESVDIIQEKFGAKIVCHEKEKEFLENSMFNLSRQLASDLKIKADITVKDGEIFKLGELNVKVIHTPGHTNGSCCYVAENHMFTGDTVMEGTIGRTDLPTGDYMVLMSSIGKLQDLEKNYIMHCGHGHDTNLDFEKKSNRYFR